jgi:hypothetical protein
MTFYANADAAQASPFNTHKTCLSCGEPIDGPTVGYDLILPGTKIYTRALFHRDCAFAIAQRIICYAWPNRRTGEWMRNDR